MVPSLFRFPFCMFSRQDFLRLDLSSLGAVRLLYLDHTGSFASRASHIEAVGFCFSDTFSDSHLRQMSRHVTVQELKGL